MTRRRIGLLVSLALALLVVPLMVEAQPRGKIPRVGVLEPGSQQRHVDCLLAFQQGLRDLGYVEGQHVLFEYRYADEQPDRLPVLAAELVRLAPDVIWQHSMPAVLVAKRVITTIPVVIGVGSNLEELGIVASLGRPGENLTGMEFRAHEIMGKQLELFKGAVPTISHVAVLVDPARSDYARVPSNIEPEARALGVQLQRVEAGAPEAFEAAFAAIAQGGANALMITDIRLFATHRQRLMELALRHRLPTMSGGRFFAEAGSLLAYGADAREVCQRSAIFVDKILKGAKPADLPIERPEFHLVVNLKTAEALELTIPPAFLFLADEVIR
jgi:putative tryptophan/tyrosine transport system substrate-binding protein